MNYEFMTIDTPLPPCMPFPIALTGFPVSSTAKVMYCRMLDATIIDTIRSMPETYRAVLEMRLVEERTTREIAAALGLSEGAVNTRISRGRALLAEKLRKEGYTA